MIQDFDGHRPQIHPTAWVHPTAVLIGEVVLHERVTVWPTVVLRGDMGLVEIGEDSNVQDGTIAHDTADFSETRVGRRCTIGHRVVLHGCHIEDDCLIGMGSVVLDNVTIGHHSLIAAGSLLTPGTVIPPHSLVMGSPGKVRREVGERELGMIEDGWRSYARKLAKWKAGAGG